MNAAAAHLLVTHLPVFGTVFGLLALALGWSQRSLDVQRCSFLLFVLSGLGAVPAYLTGAPAADILGRVLGATMKNAGDQHAEIAMIALVITLTLGVVSLLGLVLYRRPKTVPVWYMVLVVVLGLLGAASMGWAAHLGGRIRHPEIQQPSASGASFLGVEVGV